MLTYAPLLLTLALQLTAPAPAPTAPASSGGAEAALDRLRGLAGDWEGTLEWTGARTGTDTLSATYSVTGMGSAVIETLVMKGKPSMSSVYHVDGADLRVTHYCGARNQPRLRAQQPDPASGRIDFTFVDATNLASPDAPHVDGIELLLADADHVTVIFHFTAAGKDSRERIELHRVGPRPATASGP